MFNDILHVKIEVGSMKKLLRITKTTRVFRLKEMLNDIRSGVADEDILGKYRISHKQLGRIYSKLFYEGHLTKRDIVRRVGMRAGKDSSGHPVTRSLRHRITCTNALPAVSVPCTISALVLVVSN